MGRGTTLYASAQAGYVTDAPINSISVYIGVGGCSKDSLSKKRTEVYIGIVVGETRRLPFLVRGPRTIFLTGTLDGVAAVVALNAKEANRAWS